MSNYLLELAEMLESHAEQQRKGVENSKIEATGFLQQIGATFIDSSNTSSYPALIYNLDKVTIILILNEELGFCHFQLSRSIGSRLVLTPKGSIYWKNRDLIPSLVEEMMNAGGEENV